VPTPRVVEVSEYGQVVLDLNERQARTLQAVAGPHLAVVPANTGYKVRATSFVGSIAIPGWVLHIVPKVSTVGNVLDLMTWSTHRLLFHEDDVGLRSSSLAAAVAALYSRSLDRTLARGVDHAYVEEDDRLVTLRGRVDLPAQARAVGLAVPIACRYDEWSIDTASNRLVRAAALALLRMPDIAPSSGFALRRAIWRLDGVTQMRSGESAAPTPDQAQPALCGCGRPCPTRPPRCWPSTQPRVSGDSVFPDQHERRVRGLRARQPCERVAGKAGCGEAKGGPARRAWRSAIGARSDLRRTERPGSACGGHQVQADYGRSGAKSGLLPTARLLHIARTGAWNPDLLRCRWRTATTLCSRAQPANHSRDLPARHQGRALGDPRRDRAVSRPCPFNCGPNRVTDSAGFTLTAAEISPRRGMPGTVPQAATDRAVLCDARVAPSAACCETPGCRSGASARRPLGGCRR